MSNNPERTARIVLQHLHDVRNLLNSIDLEAVLLTELATDPNVVQAMGRIRRELKHLEAVEQSLMFKFTDPRPSAISSRDLLQLWQQQIAPLEDATHQIEWSETGASAVITMDANPVLAVLRGLILNAWSHYPRPVVKAAIINTATTVILELREAPTRPALPPAPSADEQLLVQRNGGTLVVATDEVTLEQVTSLRFPVTLIPTP